MRYELLLSPQAIRDIRSLSGRLRAELREQLEVHLRHSPSSTSRSRIKRLRGLGRPQYRLRVGDLRVFYDIEGGQVHILTIVSKGLAQGWLERHGVAE